MLAVAAEQLVGPLAGQRHGHVLARQLAQREEPERRQVGQRLVEMPDEPRELVGVAPRGHLELVMVGAVPLRHPAGVAQLRVLAGEADGEGLDRLGHVPVHQLHDQARVEAAAEHGSERNVAHEAQAHRLVELLEQHLGPLVIGAVDGIGRRSRVAPPALDRGAAVGHDQALAGLELPDPEQRGHRPGHVAQREVGGDRLGVELRAHEAAREHGLELRAEHHEVAHERVVERLDAQPVADQHAAALDAVPGGHGEHAAQAAAPGRGRAPRRGAGAPRCRSGCAGRGRARAAPRAARRGCRSRRSGPPTRGRPRRRTAGGRPPRR